MNPLLTVFIIYFIGVTVAAFTMRYLNSKEQRRYNCIPPIFCFLSFVTVIICFGCVITDFFNDGKMSEFFNYTDKDK